MSNRYEDDYEQNYVPVRRRSARAAGEEGAAPAVRPRKAAPAPAAARKTAGSGSKSGTGRTQGTAAKGARPASASTRPASASTRPASASTRPASASTRPAPQGPEGAHRRAAPQAAASRQANYRSARRRPRRKKRSNPMVTVLYWVLAIAVAFGISFFLHTYCFEVIRVSGDAMYDTLMQGDLALVTKFDFNDGTEPVRGDVVAIGMGSQKGVMMRRVVGLPGQTVEVIEGQAYVDGAPLLEQYIALKNYDHFEGKTVPPDKYYVLSDNRNERGDSRDDDVGLVDREDIVGRVRCVIWPLNHMGGF